MYTTPQNFGSDTNLEISSVRKQCYLLRTVSYRPSNKPRPSTPPVISIFSIHLLLSIILHIYPVACSLIGTVLPSIFRTAEVLFMFLLPFLGGFIPGFWFPAFGGSRLSLLVGCLHPFVTILF